MFLNYPRPVSFAGQHYPGFTVHPGVACEAKSYPCDENALAIDFQNTDLDTSGLFIPHSVLGSTLEASDLANPHYLQVTAAVPV